MSVTVTLAGGAITYNPTVDQLNGLTLQFAAFDGEVGIGQWPVEDASASLSTATGRQAKLAVNAVVLTDGFIVDNDRNRGPEVAGTAREYTFSVMDANALLDGFRVLRTRPSETDYARVIAFAAADLPSAATTYVKNTSTVTMPKKKYENDGGWGDLITDLTEFTGKTLFLHTTAAGGLCLHYHVLTDGHTCGLTIDDSQTPTNTLRFAPQNPRRQRTSVDLGNSIKGRDQANRVYIASDATSVTTHNADGLFHQKLVDFEATSQADLNVKTQAYLASNKDDYDTYTCAIGPMNSDSLALIRVGDIITVTSSVMGLIASPQRIAHMTATPIGSGVQWALDLELGAPIRRRARVKVGAAIGRIIVPTPPFDQNKGCNDVVLSGAWTTSQTNMSVSISGVTGTFTNTNIGSTPHQSTASKTTSLGTRPYEVHAFFTAPAYVTINGGDICYLECDDGGGIVSSVQCAVEDLGGIGEHRFIVNPRTGSAIDFGEVGVGPYFLDCGIRVGTSGTIEVRGVSGTHDTGWVSQTGTSGTLASVALLVSHGDESAVTTLTDITITESSIGCVPSVGQAVAPESVGTGDGATTAFTTDFPYQPGTLRIFLNGTPEFGFTETNPAIGAFSFTAAPFLGEVITATYVALGGGG